MAPTLSSGGQAVIPHAFQAANPEPGWAVIPYDAWPHLRDSLRLSDREMKLVQGIFADEEQENIAESLGIEPGVVYKMLQRIYVKLHIGSRTELIVRVMSEYLAFVADQPQPDFYESSYWVG